MLYILFSILFIVFLFVLLASIMASLGIQPGPVLFPFFSVFMIWFSSSNVILFCVSFVSVLDICFILSLIVLVQISEGGV